MRPPLLLACAPWLLGTATAATPIELELAPDAPRGCPAEAALKTHVAQILGYAPFEPQAATRIAVTMADAPPGLRADVHLWRAGRQVGERVLRVPVPDCAELAFAVALHVAIVVEPRRALPRPGAAAPGPIESEVRLGVGLATGLTPGVTAALGGGVSVRRGAVSGALDVRYDVPSGVDHEGGTVSVDLLAATLAGCLHSDRYRGCVLALGGVQRYEGAGFDVTRSSRFAALAFGVRGAVAWALGDAVNLHLRADVLAAVHDVTLRGPGNAVAWSSAPVAGTLALDAGYSF